MNKMKKETGITLLAIVITIVILLILVGITIYAVNDSKLFYHARRAAFIHDMKSYQELTELVLQEKRVDATQNNKEMEDINVGLDGQDDTTTVIKSIAKKYQKTDTSPEQVLIQTIISKDDNKTCIIITMIT